MTTETRTYPHIPESDSAGISRFSSATDSWERQGPSCSITDLDDCKAQWFSWDSVYKDKPRVKNGPDYPRCELGTTDCRSCYITAETVEVLYFHTPTSVSRDMCASMPVPGASYFTLPPNATTIAYTTIGDVTLYEDQIYISIKHVSAHLPWCAQPSPWIDNALLGSLYSDIIIGMPSSALSSIRYPEFDRPFEYNIADLASPIPWSAQFGLEECWVGWCTTIFADRYHPQIAVPTGLRDLDPAWASCGTPLWGLYDPPSALATAGVLTRDTQPQPSGVAAAPCSAPSPGLPPKTPASNDDAKATLTPARDAPTNTNPSQDPTPASNPNEKSPANSGSAGPASTSQVVQSIAVIGSIVTSDNSGNLVVGTNTLSNGGSPITISGTTLSFGSAGVVIADSQGVRTVELASSTQDASPTAVFSVNGQAVTASLQGSGVAIDGQTLSVGGPPATIDGTIISLGQGGLEIGGTSAVRWETFQKPTPTVGAVISAAGAAITAIGKGSDGRAIVIDGQVLSIGGSALTINGKTFSAAPGGLLVDGTATLALTALPQATYPSSSVLITINGHVYTAYRASPTSFVVGSVTVFIGGPPVTIDGQKISLAENGLVVGDSTIITLNAQPTNSSVPIEVSTTSLGIGGYIASGLGQSESPTQNSPKTSTKTSTSHKLERNRLVSGLLGIHIAWLLYGV
jgi:hypothetical protein